jgi:hypothetical protein
MVEAPMLHADDDIVPVAVVEGTADRLIVRSQASAPIGQKEDADAQPQRRLEGCDPRSLGIRLEFICRKVKMCRATQSFPIISSRDADVA